MFHSKKKEEGRRKFGNGFCNGCNGCNGCQEEGRREEGRGKKEGGRRKRGEECEL
ncbi:MULTISPECIES: hypothetical protein [unclassified Microcoleus]|uniref:hypothetical protein n=1 Tax=unclassified Microcoleus TaxID=2642155 RepID=UPI002FD38A06